MSLVDHVAQKLYERGRATSGWDDAPDVVREVFLVNAETAVRTVAEWLEAVSRSRTVGARLGAVQALHGVSQLIRRAAGLGPAEAPLTPAAEATVADESPARRELREALEGFM